MATYYCKEKLFFWEQDKLDRCLALVKKQGWKYTKRVDLEEQGIYVDLEFRTQDDLDNFRKELGEE